MKDLVSIVIPVKNGLPYIKDTVNSVLTQSYKYIEIIVVDDGSTDETVNLIKTNYPNIVLIENNTCKHGAPVCRNIGYQTAKGTYIIFLDADDLLSTHCVGNRVKLIEEYPDLDFCVYQCELFKNTPGDIGLFWNYFSNENDLDRFIRVDTPWQTTGPLWKKSALSTIGGWDESALSWQDWEFHIRALIADLKYKKVATADFYYRKEVKNSVSTKDGTLERTLFFSDLYKKINDYLVNSGKLTKKRKNYLVSLFIRLALHSALNYRKTRIISEILNKANQANLINKLSVYFLSHMLYMFTSTNYFLKKIGWYALKPTLLIAWENNDFQKAEVLFKENTE